MPSISIHPSVDSGFRATDAAFDGGTLVSDCARNPVKIRVKGNIAHSHACGCTKCWKPKGAVFSIVAVAPAENVEVVKSGDKLAVVDPAALIQRPACTSCGVNMYGPVERDHPFKGVTFLHPERFQEPRWPRPVLPPSSPQSSKAATVRTVWMPCAQV